MEQVKNIACFGKCGKTVQRRGVLYCEECLEVKKSLNREKHNNDIGILLDELNQVRRAKVEQGKELDKVKADLSNCQESLRSLSKANENLSFENQKLLHTQLDIDKSAENRNDDFLYDMKRVQDELQDTLVLMEKESRDKLHFQKEINRIQGDFDTTLELLSHETRDRGALEVRIKELEKELEEKKLLVKKNTDLIYEINFLENNISLHMKTIEGLQKDKGNYSSIFEQLKLDYDKKCLEYNKLVLEIEFLKKDNDLKIKEVINEQKTNL